jgi:hypothetical protein
LPKQAFGTYNFSALLALIMAAKIVAVVIDYLATIADERATEWFVLT